MGPVTEVVLTLVHHDDDGSETDVYRYTIRGVDTLEAVLELLAHNDPHGGIATPRREMEESHE